MATGRMIMEAPALDLELVALKKRVTALEEQVRTLTAANLSLVRSVERLHLTQPDLERC
ncbi:hypothetical protein [Nonomuraea indica]|uniref:hypothetical protein n=1 Tax=Nonomuraea indica TaxID=1581193 RepID=UPI0015DF4F45|nr:hypothetical protein [Nonomuraea indica]